MYIEEIRLRNYKNFLAEKVVLNSGINVVIGENDSGKTNLMQAIRLVLDKKLPWFEKEIREDMFPLSLEDWKGHLIIISIIFNGLRDDNEYESMFKFSTVNDDNKGSLNLFIMPNKSTRHKLYGKHTETELKVLLNEITINDYEMIFTTGLSIDYTQEEEYINLVGDFKLGEYKLPSDLDDARVGCRGVINLENIRSNLFNFTYIDALRDSVREMNQKSNPLMSLIKQIEPNITSAEKEDVSKKINDLNEALSSVTEITELSKNINQKINESVGDVYSPNISLRSDMSNDIKDVFRNLKLKSNAGRDLDLNEIGLGSNNVIYIALKLLENMNNKKSSDKFFLLLFEEPEAHLHKHLQMSLFDKTSFYSDNNVQILMSTHSDSISAASKIGSMSILQKNSNRTKIINPSKGLAPEEVERIERYLDVKRTELLFSRSVILVEGDAEEILIPIIIKQVLGLTLDELGVSLINIGSVGFKNIYNLFNPQRITKKCAIISDLDTPIEILEGREDNAFERGKNRKTEIEKESITNKYVKGFFGTYTFEVELVQDNTLYMDKLIETTYKDITTKEEAKREIASKNVSIFGKRALLIATNNSKGWNALLLSKIADGKFHIPEYILDALLFVAKPILAHDLNVRTMLNNYAKVYEDKSVSSILDEKGKIEQTDLDSVENSDVQIINFIRKVIV